MLPFSQEFALRRSVSLCWDLVSLRFPTIPLNRSDLARKVTEVVAGTSDRRCGDHEVRSLKTIIRTDFSVHEIMFDYILEKYFLWKGASFPSSITEVTCLGDAGSSK